MGDPPAPPPTPPCPRKLTSSTPSPTLPSSSSRRPLASWTPTRTDSCPPPTSSLPSAPTARTSVVERLRLCYDEVSKKLQVTESDLERAEERGEMGETKIMELEEELKVVATNLKSLEVAEGKANQREVSYKEQIKTLTAKLKQAEARAEFAEKSVQKLQKEVDRLEDELMGEQEKLKGITEELEQTFAEMSGY